MQEKSPLELLKPSYSVELLIKQESGDPILLRTLVESGVENGLLRVIAPTIQGKVYLFDSVHDVDVQYSGNVDGKNKIISLPCRFHRKFRSENFSIVELKIVGEPSVVQRRSAFRVNFNENFHFEYKDERSTLVTKDLSLKGMMAATAVKMEEGDILTMFWDKTGEAEAFPILGTVLSCKKVEAENPYEIRVLFEPLSDKHSQILLAYLFKKQSEVLQGDVELMEKLWRSAERKHTDAPEVQITTIFSLIAVVLLVVGLVFYMQAKPPTSYVLDDFFSFSRTVKWKPNELMVSLVVSLIAVVSALVSLAMKYHFYRKGKYRFTFAAFIVLAFSLFFFGHVLMLSLSNAGIM